MYNQQLLNIILEGSKDAIANNLKLTVDHNTFEEFRKTTQYNYILDENKLMDINIVANRDNWRFSSANPYPSPLLIDCKGYIVYEDQTKYIVQLTEPKQINYGRGCTLPSRYYAFNKSTDPNIGNTDNTGNISYYHFNEQILKNNIFNATPYTANMSIWTFKNIQSNKDTISEDMIEEITDGMIIIDI